MSVVSRLRRMTREEAAWRLRARARIERQRLAYYLHRPRWHREAIGRVLTGDVVDAPLRSALAARDWMAVQASLEARVKSRPSRFVLDHRTADRLRREVADRWPEAPAEAARRGDRVAARTYDLLGYRGITCTDWHADEVNGGRMPTTFWASVRYLDPVHGDHKVVWELNRHQHWQALARAAWLTEDASYAGAIVDELHDWLPANPPLTGANWASMLELSFRSISWVWALHALLGIDNHAARSGAPWLVDMLVGLDRQLSHVAANLSYYFSPNTHLTGEALGLYVVGHAVPELAGSAKWIDIGRRVLIDEIERQIAPDGGHVERSMHYQRYTLDFYLLALRTAEITGDADGVRAFQPACSRLAEFTREMADDAGTLPTIGDDDGGMLWPMTGRDPRDVRDSLAVAAALLDRPELAPWGTAEEAVWLLGPGRAGTPPYRQPRRDRLRSRVFEQTGYVAVRSGGDQLVFDAGPHGYLNGGHAHADALAVTLHLGGTPLLIDPGTATYTMDAEVRDRMRGSAAHNTLTLNGQSSSIAAGPFHWRTRADAHLAAWRANAGLCWAEAAHDGYQPVRHRRSIVHVRDAGWLIVDEVVGEGRHRADLHWHIDPGWFASIDYRHRVRLTGGDGSTAWLVHEPGESSLAFGDKQSGLGWYSPVYGVQMPTSCIRVGHDEVAPFARATWIVAGEAMPRLERVPVDGDSITVPVGLRVSQGRTSWTTLLRPGEPPRRDARSCSSADYHTDARLLQYAVRGGRLVSLAMADASHLLALNEELVSISSDVPVPDLFLAVDGERLDVAASVPPVRLRLEGGGVAGVRTLRLNGRERRHDAGAIELGSADWAICAESPVLSI